MLDCAFLALEENPKRHAILVAAATLFLEHGFETVSMDAIAKTAEVSKRTVYSYFESKETLLGALTRLACTHMQQQIIRRGGLEGSPEEALFQLGVAFIELMQAPQSMAFYRLVVGISARFPEVAREFYENGPRTVRGLTRSYLERQVEAGILEIQDCDVAAKQFLGMVKMPFYFERMFDLAPPPEPERVEAMVGQAVSLFLHGCQVRESRGRSCGFGRRRKKSEKTGSCFGRKFGFL